jgi:hypothetical protein
MTTKAQFLEMIGGHGFVDYEPAALENFDSLTNTMLHKALMNHVGGRVSMPSDYFGTQDTSLVNDTSGTHASMSIATDTLIRPELPATFKGGSKLFESTLKACRQCGGAPKKLQKEKKVAVTRNFFGIIDALFIEVRKFAPKTKILKAHHVERASKKI